MTRLIDVTVPDIGELQHICEEEARHFGLIAECIEKLGGDPTAQTPCADVTGVESSGLMQVVTDPKTTVNQSLHALLVAELADNAAWEELIVLAKALGQDEMVQRFEEALGEEREHLLVPPTPHQAPLLPELRHPRLRRGAGYERHAHGGHQRPLPGGHRSRLDTRHRVRRQLVVRMKTWRTRALTPVLPG